MKKCRQCSRRATVHITEVQGGEAYAVHLCEGCAKEYVEEAESDPQDSLIKDITEKLEKLSRASGTNALDNLTCSDCGLSFNEFREKGRLGCPSDYDEFQDELLPLLAGIHDGVVHTGKRPLRNSGNEPTPSEIIRLRSRLREAVEAEDYENAAELRDQIAAMESGHHSGVAKSPSGAIRAKSESHDLPSAEENDT